MLPRRTDKSTKLARASPSNSTSGSRWRHQRHMVLFQDMVDRQGPNAARAAARLRPYARLLGYHSLVSRVHARKEVASENTGERFALRIPQISQKNMLAATMTRLAINRTESVHVHYILSVMSGRYTFSSASE